jgi:hypothetical protein
VNTVRCPDDNRYSLFVNFSEVGQYENKVSSHARVLSEGDQTVIAPTTCFWCSAVLAEKTKGMSHILLT